MNFLQSLKVNYLFFLLSICLPSITFALSLTTEEKEWIQQHPSITLGSDQAWPPYDFKNNQNIHSGISADFLQLIKDRTGLKIEVESGVWSTILKKAKMRKLDGLACAAKTPEREKYFHFSTPYTSMPLAIIVQSNRTDINSFSDLKNQTVSINNGSYLHEWFTENHPEIKLHLSNSNSESLEAVSVTQADAYVGNIGVATYIINEKYLTNLKIVDKVEGFQTDTSFAIDINQPVLASIIQKALDSITNEERKKINLYWFGASQQNDAQSFLSADEKQWIKNHSNISVAGGFDWAPFDFVNAQGAYDGITNDYLTLIENRTGLTFNVELDLWENSLQKLESNKIDLVTSAYKTKDRERYSLFSTPYFDLLDYFFIRSDLNAKTIEDLNGKVAAIPKEFAHIELLQKHYPQIQILEVPTFSDAIDAVLEGRADILFESYAAISYALSKQGINTIVPFKSSRKTGDNQLHMMARKDYPQLISIINKTLASISPQEKRKIYEKWLPSPDNANLLPEITLSQKEVKWLDKNPVLTFSGRNNWMPLEAITHSGEHIGIVAEYLKKIQSLFAEPIKRITAESWDETLQLAQNGTADIISADLRNHDLTENYTSIPSYFEAPIVIVMRNSNDFVNDLADIDHLKISVLRGLGYTNQLKEAYPTQNFIEVDSTSTALENLALGQTDAVLISLPNATYALKEQNLQNLKIVGKTSVKMQLTLFVLKNKPELYQIVTNAIGSIPPQTASQIAGKWSTVEFAKQLDYRLIVQISGGSLLIIGIIIYWNRRLTKEIGQRKELEAKLIKSQNQIQALIDNIPMKILVTDSSGCILSVNAQTLKDYNITLEQALTLNINDYYVNPDERQRLFEKLAAEGNIDQEVVKFKDNKNREKSFMISITPIEYNEQEAYLTLAIDLSERIEAENQLRLAKEQAEMANQAKSEFLSNMSHEIRTPMNAILGFTEILQEQVTDPKLQNFIQTIHKAGNTLLRLINDILDLSKIEAGKLKLNYTATNPYEVFKEVSDIFTMNIRNKDLELITSIDESIPKSLLLDATRLRQVLFNLVGNAVKFTEHGHIKISVYAKNHDEAHSKIDLGIDIEDTGIGIANDQKERIFASFEQQQGQDIKKFGGTGLGLNISKRLVTLMGGTISVTSQLGSGSCFTITLEQVDIASVQAQGSSDKSLKFNADSINYSPANVLIVDDIQDNRELLQHNLANTALNIYTAENGQIAIEQFMNHQIDLVIMDIRMPVMDGYQAAKQIKHISPNTPIIALTASVMQNEFQQLKSDNFDAYLRKPVLKAELFKTLIVYLKHQIALDPSIQTSDAQHSSSHALRLNKDDIDATLIELLEKAITTNNIDTIEKFAVSANKLASITQSESLSEYSDQLLVAIEGFNIQKIQQLLREFKQTYQNLEDTKS